MENGTLRRWMEPMEALLAPVADTTATYSEITGVPIDLPTALFLRASLAGYEPPTQTSANGSCHLLETASGWAAVNLARPDDIAAVPALLAMLPETVPTASDVAAGAQFLGVAAACLGADSGARPPVRPDSRGEREQRDFSTLKVVDLSALWAGPLCARLLRLAGMRVTTVESATRPDSMRTGSPEFYRWLHEGCGRQVIDFFTPALAKAVEAADVVIEASRPRALRRLGIHAERFLAARPGRVWISITGYGRDDTRIAFGDDAAVAGGLAGRDQEGRPTFLGDAIADPVTGLFAASAAVASLTEGGGDLLCVSMAACASAMADAAAPC